MSGIRFATVHARTAAQGPHNRSDDVIDLASALQRSLANPLIDDVSIDPVLVLKDLLPVTGHRVEDAGGRIEFVGRDPIVVSPWPLATAGAVAMMAMGIAMADLWRIRTGEGQDLSIDLRQMPHRLCPFYDRKWERLNGLAPGAPSDPANPLTPFNMYLTADGRWMQFINIYPKAKSKALAFFGTNDCRSAIASVVRGWKGADLEVAANEIGVQATMIRSAEEFMAEAQFDHLAQAALVSIEKIGESEPIPFSSSPSQPLDGMRALGLSHVIAGPGLGRALAYHGADVINIWRPTDFELDFLYYSSNVGLRSAILDIDSVDGRARLGDLLQAADVFFTNRRPGFPERYGLSANDLAEVRPGIIHVQMSLYGSTGPWRHRTGFDQNAGGVTGVFAREGTPDRPKLTDILVVNDYVTSWLASTAVAAVLKRRAREGGSYRIEISLARVAVWLMQIGYFDKSYASEAANSSEDHLYLPPSLFTADTPCGRYQGVTDQLFMSRTPGRYRTPLVPRGSSKPEWLPYL
jgi:crotonobetainyl-CoA:carnitine CoA-transferase CaiB-like acyl-CoA transferase